MGQGGLSKKAHKVQEDSRCKGIIIEKLIQTRSKYLVFSGQGGFQIRLTKYKKLADSREYRETHAKQKLNAYALTLGV